MTGELIVLGGAPGVGKTTVARLLAREASAPTVHLGVDTFFRAIGTGFVLPFLPEAHRQNGVVMDAIAASVDVFVRGGYDVVVEGVIGPWFLPPFRALTARARLFYVVLRADLDTTISRATSRKGDELRDVEPITGLHGAFTDLGALESHALDSSHMSADQTASAIREMLGAGRCRLD